MGKTTKPHEPTPQTRAQVQTMSMAGIRQETIADIVDVDPKTLRKYYRKELDHATAKVISQTASLLFDQCKAGNVSAMMFLLKTRGGWRETNQIDHTSSDGSMTPKPFSGLYGSTKS